MIFTPTHNTMGHKWLKICLDNLSHKIVDITTGLLTTAILEE